MNTIFAKSPLAGELHSLSSPEEERAGVRSLI